MENNGLTASDVLALDKNNGDFNNGGMAFWIFALLCLGGGNGFGFGNNRGDFVTNTDLQLSQNAQTNTFQLQGISDQIANNRFDIVTALTNQNNSNLINAIQGFNTLGLQVTNQTNVLSSQLQQLGSQLNECCCSIKTQILQDRLDEAERRNVVLQNAIDNANQSQYILGQLGRYVAWAGSGSQGAAVAAG